VRTAPIRKIVRQRIAAVTVGVFVAGLLISVSGSAGAVPMPTVAQVQQRLRHLQLRANQLDQQYDQVQQQLQQTDQRLALVRKQLAVFSTEFDSWRDEIDRIAVTAYEDGSVNSTVTLLISGDPQHILNQSSILLALSDNDNAQISQFLAAARQLYDTEQLVSRTRLGIEQLRADLARRKAYMNKLVAQEQALLNQLTPAQQTGVGGGTGGETGITPVKYTGPTTSQADKAVAYAYAQVGCPYVYGGTGPCPDGFDCSGLTMMSWAAAGVSIPRTSYEQAGLPAVSLDDVQPGDILLFYANSHVALYVGHNEFIQAPMPGQDVQIVAYQGADTPGIDGAVEP
jgi:peptidoglycan DL-endopeptidase CwlO